MSSKNDNQANELSNAPTAEPKLDPAQRLPPGPSGTRRNPTTIRLTKRMQERLDRVSRRFDRPKSQLIRESIEALLERYERRLR